MSLKYLVRNGGLNHLDITTSVAIASILELPSTMYYEVQGDWGHESGI